MRLYKDFGKGLNSEIQFLAMEREKIARNSILCLNHREADAIKIFDLFVGQYLWSGCFPLPILHNRQGNSTTIFQTIHAPFPISSSEIPIFLRFAHTAPFFLNMESFSLLIMCLLKMRQ